MTEADRMVAASTGLMGEWSGQFQSSLQFFPHSVRLIPLCLSLSEDPPAVIAIQWNERLYMYVCRQSPPLWSALNTTPFCQCSRLGHSSKSVWHYVDDFILAGESHSNQCATSVVSALQAFHELGVPIEPEYPEPCTGDMPRLSNIPSQKRAANQTPTPRYTIYPHSNERIS